MEFNPSSSLRAHRLQTAPFRLTLFSAENYNKLSQSNDSPQTGASIYMRSMPASAANTGSLKRLRALGIILAKAKRNVFKPARILDRKIFRLAVKFHLTRICAESNANFKAIAV